MKVILFFSAMLAWPALFFQVRSAPELAYKDRGGYHEGIRTAPSTGAELDLVAAMINQTEPYSALPPSFRALFYLPNRDPVHLTIREVNRRYFYWLDRFASTNWQAHKVNNIHWETGPVFQFLRGTGGPLKLEELGAVVRLGKSGNAADEVVAPVALYHANALTSIESYRFVFLPSRQMRLKFEVFAKGTEDKAQPLMNQIVPIAPANFPQSVTWKIGTQQDGWFELIASGYFLSSEGERIRKRVTFFHSAQLAK